MPVPGQVGMLDETIRNLFFHVPMWFSMITMLLISAFYGIVYLRTQNPKHDMISSEAAHVGILFGILGLLTGMIWAQFTWG